MKLNIGCGYNLLSGYTNIDLNPETPAGKIMPAHNLDFADAVVEEIKALQLIEHLGFFKTRYFLAECRRILEPGGRLIIETPDIAKTFENFLNGDCEAKEAALGWVYGSETKGMSHLYCFPADLLAAIIKTAGFEIVESAAFYFQPNRPALRFIAVKKKSPEADLEANLRKRLLSAEIPFFEDEIIISEQEKVIKSLLSALSPDEALRQAVCSAEITGEYFSLSPFGNEGNSVRQAVCDCLLERNLQGYLMMRLKKNAVNGFFTPADFNSVFAAGLDYLNRVISGKPPFVPAPAPKIKIFSRACAEDYCFKNRLFCK
ncbi:MAG TPA: SAM-dependent methyltransferase [Elusimicrobia bacterium]|nr:SAM-dependent methyltransferase [Elusimicrobiota bacterium]